MGILTSMLRQYAALWRTTGTVDSNGQPTFAAAVRVKIRWSAIRDIGAGEGEVLEKVRGGHILNVRAGYRVGVDLKLGDYLKLLTDKHTPIPTDTDPRDTTAWEVQSSFKIPNFRGIKFLRKGDLAPSHLALQAMYGRGIEAATYHKISGGAVTKGVLSVTDTSVTLAVAVKGPINVDEVELGRGRSLSSAVVWDVPRKYLVDTPTLEDYIIDADSKRWNVVSVMRSPIRSWWRFITRGGGV